MGRKLRFRFWQFFARAASFEWLLTPTQPNGGDIVLLRAVCVALEMVLVTLILMNVLDPCLSWYFSVHALQTQLIELSPWFAAATGAVYAALYTRFSSQWSYLATLYNQIKQTEVQLLGNTAEGVSNAKDKLAQWKAGYIEDAQDLHLHTKPNIAGIIHFWSQDSTVADAFIKGAPGGQARWDKVQADVSAAYSIASKQWT
jgi:hypothetical protein